MKQFQIWSLNWNRTTVVPVFGQKKKTVEIWQIWPFCHFWPFSTVFLPKKKRGQMLFYFNFETRFGILSSWWIFLTPKFKKLTIFLTIISKTSTILRGSLHLTDRLQISYTVFWHHAVTCEILTPCAFPKKGVFHSTLMHSRVWLTQRSNEESNDAKIFPRM